MPNLFRNHPDAAARACSSAVVVTGDKPFLSLICILRLVPGPQMSWAGLDREVGSLSRFLAHVPSLEPGNRLGVLGRNSAEYLQVSTEVGYSSTTCGRRLFGLLY